MSNSRPESIVATSDGRVIRARAVHPRPETVKITRESLNNIKVGPWNPSEVITQDSVGRPAPMVEVTQPPPAGGPVPRNLRITEEHLLRFNYTKGCPKCEAIKRGDPHKDVRHSTACRQRLEEEMKQDDVMSKRLAEVEERKNRFLARRVEASDQTRVEEGHAEEQGSVEPVELLASGQCSTGEDKSVTGHGRMADFSVKPARLLASRQ